MILYIHSKGEHPKERKEVHKMSTTMYLNFIKSPVTNEGIKVADIANKKALEMKEITTEQYIEAARIIVKARLA